MVIDLYWNGTFNATISARTTNTGSYSWTLPSGLDNSTLYQIKITDVSNSSTYDFSDYFEIFTPHSPHTPHTSGDSITVTNPSGSETWLTGSNYGITWTSTGSIANVLIELYISGILDSVINSDTTNDGELSWSIPYELGNSTEYQIKISDVANSTIYDYSDYFSIHTEQEIPGYNLYFLIMIIGIVSVVLIKKKHKHLKK